MMISIVKCCFYRLRTDLVALCVVMALPIAQGRAEALQEVNGRILLFGNMSGPPGADIIAYQDALGRRMLQPIMAETLTTDEQALAALDAVPRDVGLAMIRDVLPAPDPAVSLLLQRAHPLGQTVNSGVFLDPFQKRELAAAVRRHFGANTAAGPALLRVYCPIQLNPYNFDLGGFPLRTKMEHRCAQNSVAFRGQSNVKLVTDFAEFPEFVPMPPPEAKALYAAMGPEPAPLLAFDAIAVASSAIDRFGRSIITVKIDAAPPYELADPVAPAQTIYQIPYQSGTIFDLYDAEDLAGLVAQAKTVDPAAAMAEPLFGESDLGFLRLRWGTAQEGDASRLQLAPAYPYDAEALGKLVGVPPTHLMGGTMVLPDPTVQEVWVVLPAPLSAWSVPRPAVGPVKNARTLLVGLDIGKAWLIGPADGRKLILSAHVRGADAVSDASNVSQGKVNFDPVRKRISTIFDR